MIDGVVGESYIKCIEGDTALFFIPTDYSHATIVVKGLGSEHTLIGFAHPTDNKSLFTLVLCSGEWGLYTLSNDKSGFECQFYDPRQSDEVALWLANSYAIMYSVK